MTDSLSTGSPPWIVLGPVFSLTEARGAGVPDQTVLKAARSGRLTRVRRGVYLDTAAWQSASPPVRHVWLADAALRLEVEAWLSHATAAVIHGAPLISPVPQRVALTRPSGNARTPAYRDGVVVYAASLPDEHRMPDDPRVTSLARTVVDLARHDGILAGLVAMDAALRAGAVTTGDLRAVLATMEGWPGRGRAAAAVGVASASAESPLESVSRWQLRDGLAGFTPQMEVLDEAGQVVGRCDLVCREHGVIGEADGGMKYDNPSVLRREKRRQEALEALGWTVVRWGWADVMRAPREVVARLTAACARRRTLRGGWRETSPRVDPSALHPVRLPSPRAEPG